MWCRTCGYALDGLTEVCCPECGRGFDPARRTSFRRSLPRPRWFRLLVRWTVFSASTIFVLLTVLYWGTISESGVRRRFPNDSTEIQFDDWRHPDWLESVGLPPRRRITDLNLAYTALEDDDIFLIGSLKRIIRLHLGNSNITDTGIRHLAGLNSLRELKLAENIHLTDAGLAHLQGLTGLVRLDLSGCGRITDSGLQSLSKMMSLEHLKLGKTNINGSGISYLAGLPKLRELILWECVQIDDRALKHIAQMPILRDLYLNDCKLITDRGIAHLADSKVLHRLGLSGCTGITGEGLIRLKHLKTLHHLDLSRCDGITNAGLKGLSGLTNLETLDLVSNSRIGDDGLRYLQKLTRLETLEIGLSNVTKDGVNALESKLPNLTVHFPPGRLNPPDVDGPL